MPAISSLLPCSGMELPSNDLALRALDGYPPEENELLRPWLHRCGERPAPGEEPKRSVIEGQGPDCTLDTRRPGEPQVPSLICILYPPSVSQDTGTGTERALASPVEEWSWVLHFFVGDELELPVLLERLCLRLRHSGGKPGLCGGTRNSSKLCAKKHTDRLH